MNYSTSSSGASASAAIASIEQTAARGPRRSSRYTVPRYDGPCHSHSAQVGLRSSIQVWTIVNLCAWRGLSAREGGTIQDKEGGRPGDNPRGNEGGRGVLGGFYNLVPPLQLHNFKPKKSEISAYSAFGRLWLLASCAPAAPWCVPRPRRRVATLRWVGLVDGTRIRETRLV